MNRVSAEDAGIRELPTPPTPPTPAQIAPRGKDELLNITAGGFAALLGPADGAEFAAAMLDSIAKAQALLPEEFHPACEAARACADLMQSTYLESLDRVRIAIAARGNGAG